MFAKLTNERDYLRAFVTVAIYAGPRRGELLKLRWSNVDFGLNLINFTETKTNRDRAVPMEPIVREALLELSQYSGKIKELMGHASIVTTMRYIHATDQGKRGAITFLSEYRQKRRHKLVTNEKRQALQPAVSR